VTNHKTGESAASFVTKYISGKSKVFSGLSQSWKYEAGVAASWGSRPAISTPTAIRHILMATSIAVPSGNSYVSEYEVSVPEQMRLDTRSIALYKPGTHGQGGVHLTQAQYKWLIGKTDQAPVGGWVLDTLREAIEGNIELQGQAAPASIQPYQQGEGHAPPPPKAAQATKNWKTPGFIGKPLLSADPSKPEDGEYTPATLAEAAKGWDIEFVVKDEHGLPELKPAKEMGFQEGDYMLGKQGTLYWVGTDISDPSGYGLRYHEIDQATGTFNGKSFNFTGGGTSKFFRIAGPNGFTYKEVKEKTDDQVEFDPQLWSQGTESFFVGKLKEGDKFKVNGLTYELQADASMTAGTVLIKSLDNGELATINTDYKTAVLIPVDEGAAEKIKAAAEPAGPVKPSAFITGPPQKDDIFAHPQNGTKYTITSVLKSGAFKAKLTGGKVTTFVSTDGLDIFRPSDWLHNPGVKTPIADLEPGDLFDLGAGAKLRPAVVVSKKGAKVTWKSVETGDEGTSLGHKAVRQIVPKGSVDAESPKVTPVDALAAAQEGKFDKSAYKVGPDSTWDAMPVGTVFKAYDKGVPLIKAGPSSYLIVHTKTVSHATPTFKAKTLHTLVAKDGAQPHSELSPGDKVALGNLKKGDKVKIVQHTGEPGGATFELLEDPQDGESTVQGKAYGSDGTVLSTGMTLEPGNDYVYWGDASTPVTPGSSAIPESGPTGTDEADTEDLPDAVEDGGYVPYKSKYGTGGTYLHLMVKEMAVGAQFRDKSAQVWVVKQSGVNAVISNGEKNFKINGDLRGRELDVNTLIDNAPALENTPASFAEAGLNDAKPGDMLNSFDWAPGDKFKAKNVYEFVGYDEAGWVKAKKLTGANAGIEAVMSPDMAIVGFSGATYKSLKQQKKQVSGQPAALGLLPVEDGEYGSFLNDLAKGDYFAFVANGKVWQVTGIGDGEIKATDDFPGSGLGPDSVNGPTIFPTGLDDPTSVEAVKKDAFGSGPTLPAKSEDWEPTGQVSIISNELKPGDTFAIGNSGSGSPYAVYEMVEPGSGGGTSKIKHLASQTGQGVGGIVEWNGNGTPVTLVSPKGSPKGPPSVTGLDLGDPASWKAKGDKFKATALNVGDTFTIGIPHDKTAVFEFLQHGGDGKPAKIKLIAKVGTDGVAVGGVIDWGGGDANQTPNIEVTRVEPLDGSGASSLQVGSSVPIADMPVGTKFKMGAGEYTKIDKPNHLLNDKGTEVPMGGGPPTHPLEIVALPEDGDPYDAYLSDDFWPDDVPLPKEGDTVWFTGLGGKHTKGEVAFVKGDIFTIETEGGKGVEIPVEDLLRPGKSPPPEDFPKGSFVKTQTGAILKVTGPGHGVVVVPAEFVGVPAGTPSSFTVDQAKLTRDPTVLKVGSDINPANVAAVKVGDKIGSKQNPTGEYTVTSVEDQGFIFKSANGAGPDYKSWVMPGLLVWGGEGTLEVPAAQSAKFGTLKTGDKFQKQGGGVIYTVTAKGSIAGFASDGVTEEHFNDSQFIVPMVPAEGAVDPLNPYKAKYQSGGKGIYPRLSELLPGTVFQDKKKQKYTLKSVADGLAVFSDPSGTQFQTSAKNRVKVLDEPTPDEAAPDVSAPTPTGGDEDNTVEIGGLEKGDQFETLGGTKYEVVSKATGPTGKVHTIWSKNLSDPGAANMPFSEWALVKPSAPTPTGDPPMYSPEQFQQLPEGVEVWTLGGQKGAVEKSVGGKNFLATPDGGAVQIKSSVYASDPVSGASYGGELDDDAFGDTFGALQFGAYFQDMQGLYQKGGGGKGKPLKYFDGSPVPTEKMYWPTYSEDHPVAHVKGEDAAAMLGEVDRDPLGPVGELPVGAKFKNAHGSGGKVLNQGNDGEPFSKDTVFTVVKKAKGGDGYVTVQAANGQVIAFEKNSIVGKSKLNVPAVMPDAAGTPSMASPEIVNPVKYDLDFYKSPYGSGGTYKHEEIYTLAAGTVFRDKAGDKFKVVKQGGTLTLFRKVGESETLYSNHTEGGKPIRVRVVESAPPTEPPQPTFKALGFEPGDKWLDASGNLFTIDGFVAGSMAVTFASGHKTTFTLPEATEFQGLWDQVETLLLPGPFKGGQKVKNWHGDALTVVGEDWPFTASEKAEWEKIVAQGMVPTATSGVKGFGGYKPENLTATKTLAEVEKGDTVWIPDPESGEGAYPTEVTDVKKSVFDAHAVGAQTVAFYANHGMYDKHDDYVMYDEPPNAAKHPLGATQTPAGWDANTPLPKTGDWVEFETEDGSEIGKITGESKFSYMAEWADGDSLAMKKATFLKGKLIAPLQYSASAEDDLVDAKFFKGLKEGDWAFSYDESGSEVPVRITKVVPGIVKGKMGGVGIELELKPWDRLKPPPEGWKPPTKADLTAALDELDGMAGAKAPDVALPKVPDYSDVVARSVEGGRAPAARRARSGRRDTHRRQVARQAVRRRRGPRGDGDPRQRACTPRIGAKAAPAGEGDAAERQVGADVPRLRRRAAQDHEAVGGARRSTTWPTPTSRTGTSSARSTTTSCGGRTGLPFRVDQGGTLFYRAQGTPKPFSADGGARGRVSAASRGKGQGGARSR
jgi:hypothetical protein